MLHIRDTCFGKINTLVNLQCLQNHHVNAYVGRMIVEKNTAKLQISCWTAARKLAKEQEIPLNLTIGSVG